jgi:adenosylhomocysteine nucleosidase
VETKPQIAVLISAGAEWRSVLPLFPQAEIQTSPFSTWFAATIAGQPAIFLHGGWGKIAAAASTQYVIDRWQPRLLVNLGTCGGFAGEIERGEIFLAERTLVYDIIEKMSDPHLAIARYSTDLDLSWLGADLPLPVRRGLLVSADRDLLVEDIAQLKALYGAVAGDWESGAIAWVAERNHIPCLILRGVSDLVSEESGEAYGDYGLFAQRTSEIMPRLVASLPDWLKKLPQV